MLRLSALLLLIASQAQAADLTGPAQVIDGDSIVVRGREIRLSGIDAPEWGQKCQKDGKEWLAGQEAAAFLKSKAEGRVVSCSPETTDKYKRQIATCYLDGLNLNEAIVRDGWAFAYLRYSDRYAPAESEAKQAGRGIWAGQCGSPEAWRHENK